MSELERVEAKIEQLQFQLARLNDYLTAVGKVAGLVEGKLVELRGEKSRMGREKLKSLSARLGGS